MKVRWRFPPIVFISTFHTASTRSGRCSWSSSISPSSLEAWNTMPLPFGRCRAHSRRAPTRQAAAARRPPLPLENTDHSDCPAPCMPPTRCFVSPQPETRTHSPLPERASDPFATHYFPPRMKRRVKVPIRTRGFHFWAKGESLMERKHDKY